MTEPKLVNNYDNPKKPQYRKIQSLVGEKSFSIVLPKIYASNLEIGKGDFVRVTQEQNKIVIEKA